MQRTYIATRVPPEDADALDALAAARGTSRSAELAKAVQTHLQHAAVEQRLQALDTATLIAVEQATASARLRAGIFVSDEELDHALVNGHVGTTGHHHG